MRWQMYANADVLVWFQHKPLVVLPVLNVTCWCGLTATPGAEGVGISRISGDSKYGYESYHVACCG